MSVAEIVKIVVAFLAAYLIGAIPFGFLIGKYNGVDIRTVGSGNIGATNVTRSVGSKAGKLCFACDFLKGFLPTLFALWVFPGEALPVLLAASATVIGHMFPCYLKFRGGKGVSTAAGAMLALAPYPLLTALLVWVAVFLISRYVSVASIAAALTLIAGVWLFAFFGLGNWISLGLAMRIFCTILGVIAIFRHRSNIVRLINGTENRFVRDKQK